LKSMEKIEEKHGEKNPYTPQELDKLSNSVTSGQMMSLPKIQPTTFMFEGKTLYYISDEQTKHKVTKSVVIANGTKDLCWASGDSLRGNRIKRISDTTKEKILWIPKGDILWLEIDPPCNGCVSMYLDVGSDEVVAKLIAAILRRWDVGPMGKDYAMYGGRDYL